MTQEFQPFRAIRYDDPSSGNADGVVVLDSVLDPTSPYSVDRLRDPEYGHSLFSKWTSEGILRIEDQPALYLYRYGRTHNGIRRQTSGVFGLVGVPTTNDAVLIVPTVTIVSAPGFSHLLTPTEIPLMRATDQSGGHHRIWPITQSGVIQTIGEAVAPFLFPGPTGSTESGLVFALEKNELFDDPDFPRADFPACGLVMVSGNSAV